MEYINATELSPLISKCFVKVCYVSDKPNRNNTVITKDVAYQMGKKLPGSPIVGFYNEETKDFEGHNREIKIGNGEFKVVDTTKPYGFVPLDAKVWFQFFRDDDGYDREYLCTECYIWTGAYPESQRLLEQGNNQSMELHKESQKGTWAKMDNSEDRIFIYNEALIEKLCILGENVEPCFEGAQIKGEFSLEKDPAWMDFKKTMYSILAELQNTLSEGGSQGLMENDKDMILDNPEFEQKKLEQEEEEKKTSTEEKSEKKQEPENKPAEKKDDEEKKEKYNLDEVVEYTELKAQYEELQSKYATLEQEVSALREENEGLNEFKLKAERKDKQNMIDSFYMLTDEDKKDVNEHIDTYSLEDIEAKLSIICVRNKVDFNLDKKQEQEESKSNPQGLFSLSEENDTAPAWVKAVVETANKI